LVRPSTFTILAKRILPDFNTRLRVRQIAGLPLDLWDSIMGTRDPLLPPRGLWFIGGGSKPLEIAEENFQRFVSDGLTPDDRVLDMGCGIGFMAVRLTKFIDGGSFHGFDVVPTAIQWASSHITKRYPNFHFQHADLFSAHYNPHGKFKPESFTFPYEADTFSFVYALSLFTHLLPSAAERYLREMARTMKPQSTGWLTAFLVNNEVAALIQAGKSSLAMTPQERCWVLDPLFPETAVGLMEADFCGWCHSAGLKVKRIDRGSWCGRSDYAGYQDHVVVEKL